MKVLQTSGKNDGNAVTAAIFMSNSTVCFTRLPLFQFCLTLPLSLSACVCLSVPGSSRQKKKVQKSINVRKRQFAADCERSNNNKNNNTANKCLKILLWVKFRSPRCVKLCVGVCVCVCVGVPVCASGFVCVCHTSASWQLQAERRRSVKHKPASHHRLHLHLPSIKEDEISKKKK